MKIYRIYQDLTRFIEPNKALIILGPRQVGKTTLMNDFILVTRNQKDFEKINGLKILNPCDEKIENIK